MGWALVASVGFVLVIALVIALARGNTARWERDHRAAQAALRARQEAPLRVRAAARLASSRAVRRHPLLPHPHLPHPHLPHLPHVHLPPWVADRLAHGRGALHPPRLRVHLPHLDGRIARRLPGRRAPDEDPAGSDTGTSGP